MLDLTSFQHALEELEKAYAKACSPEIKNDPEMFGFLRSTVIHNFEFTYELSHKFMRRFLDLYGPDRDDKEEYVFRTLLRLSHEYGLIAEVEPWLDFRSKRNITSHTYDQVKADVVFSVMPEFLREARFLMNALDKQAKAKP